MDDKIAYYIWLSRACSPGSAAAEKLLTYFDYDIISMYKATDYPCLSLLESETAERLQYKDLGESVDILEYCENNGIDIITPDQSKYPGRLKMIKNMPALLYVKGKLPDIDEKLCIAVVGTRRMTEYGKRNAYSISYDLSRHGAVIISGMALGCDAQAHRAALDAGGKTVAVLGCGIDVVYPSSHKELMEEIIEKGCVITEYAPGTPPNGYNFPKRNRIISGISNGVMVVEAPYMSGSLITAKLAVEQGRDLFALPGKVGESNSTGTNELIQDGAKAVLNARDILFEYEKLYSDKLTETHPFARGHVKKSISKSDTAASAERKNLIPPSYGKEDRPGLKSEPKICKAAAADKSAAPGLSEQQRKVYEAVFYNAPVSIDDVAAKTGLDPAEIAVAFTILELKKLIEVGPGGNAVPYKGK